jgi:hypothetical protein
MLQRTAAGRVAASSQYRRDHVAVSSFQMESLMNTTSRMVAVTLMAATVPWFAAAPAVAAPIAPVPGLHDAASAPVEAVRWRGGGGWRGGRGFGVGAGFVAGALIGGAIAGSRPYGYGGYGYGYAPGYYDSGYDDYVAVAPGGGGDGYCRQRYRSYDPASGTFLGFDGLRHPCP